MTNSAAESEKEHDQSDHDEYDARNGHHLRVADWLAAPGSNADDRDEGNHDADDHCCEPHGMYPYTTNDEIAMRVEPRA